MNNKITKIIVLIVATLVAVVLGSNVATGKYTELLTYVLIALPIVFVIWGHKYTWQISLFLTLGGIAFYHGFIYTSLHVGSALLVGMFGIHMLTGHKAGMPRAFKMSGGKLLFGASLVWIAYVVIHFAGNFAFPHIDGEFSVKNSAKAYFSAIMPALLLVWILVGPTRIRVPENWDVQLLWILFFALVVNVSYMGLILFLGYGEGSSAEASLELTEASGLHIPVINAMPNVYGLRSLGPIAVLFSMVLMTSSQWLNSQKKIIKLLILIVLMMGLVGSVLSGGRAAILISGFYGFVVLISRRRIGLILSGMGVATVVIITINLFSGIVHDHLPKMMSRPLQYIMIDKRSDAMATIENSSDYRKALFRYSIDHWMSEPRITLTGRSIYRYLDNQMDMRIRYGDKENFIVTNLRAGTCHALLPTALVQYGAFGTVIYYFWNFCIIKFFWSLAYYFRINSYKVDLETFSYAMAVLATVSLMVATIGGSWTGITVIVFIGIFAARAHQLEGEKEAEREAERIAESV